MRERLEAEAEVPTVLSSTMLFQHWGVKVETTVVLRAKRKKTHLVEMAEARMQETEDKVQVNELAEVVAEPSVVAVEVYVSG